MLERKRQRALLRLRLRDIDARETTRISFVVFCLFFSRDWQRGGGGDLSKTLFNKRVESSLSVDSKRHDERRLVMCYDVRFINVLLLCKKKFSLFLFRSLSLLSVSPFSLKWCVFCIAAVIIAPFFSSLSPSSLSFFNSFSRRAICDAYYYLLLNLTLVRVFLLNLWR